LGGRYPAHDPLTIEWKARQLFVADRQQRKREHLHSVLEFMYLNLTVNRLLPHNSPWIGNHVVSLLRKPVWVDSFGDLFGHMIRRMTSVNDLVVVRDLVVPTFCNGDDQRGIFGVDERSVGIRTNERRRREASWVVDYLPVPPCTHYGVWDKTFSTGETIKMCPDCSNAFTSTETLNAFDKQRRIVLMNGAVDKATPVAEALWDAQLDALELSMWRASIGVNFLWGDFDELADREDSASEQLFCTPSGRVSTVGSAGTDHDGERHDSNARDRRAKKWFAEQQGKEPKTETFDWWSGETIYDRAGTKFNTNTRNRQNFWEEWGRLRMIFFEIALAQPSDTLLRLYLLIESERS
jgi:hypothetical protein